MKKVIFFAVAMILMTAGKADAQLLRLQAVPIAEIIKSTVVCATVKISSGPQVQRIDNLTKYGVLPGREWVRLVNHDTGDKLYFDYELDMSTDTASSNCGEFLNPEGKIHIGAVSNARKTIAIYGKAVNAAGAAGIRLQVCQGK